MNLKFKDNKKAWSWLIAGIILILYFTFEAVQIGVTFSSLIWVWGATGLVFIVFALLTFKFGRIPVPKWLFRAAVVILILVLAYVLFIECFVISGMFSKGEDDLDYIIVLGAHVNKNGNPSRPLYWRIDAAEKYLAKNPDTIAILSGGQGSNEPISEAQCMYNELVKRGISPSRLIIEDISTDTNENIRFSLEHIPSDATIGIVTNNFHVFRAVQIAEKISGREISGIASKYIDTLLLHYMLREAVGISTDMLGGNMDLF